MFQQTSQPTQYGLALGAASPYLTDVQVAKHLNISTGTVRRWRLFKEGPPYSKIGNSVRYHYNDIAEFVRSGRVSQHA